TRERASSAEGSRSTPSPRPPARPRRAAHVARKVLGDVLVDRGLADPHPHRQHLDQEHERAQPVAPGEPAGRAASGTQATSMITNTTEVTGRAPNRSESQPPSGR